MVGDHEHPKPSRLMNCLLPGGKLPAVILLRPKASAGQTDTPLHWQNPPAEGRVLRIDKDLFLMILRDHSRYSRFQMQVSGSFSSPCAPWNPWLKPQGIAVHTSDRVGRNRRRESGEILMKPNFPKRLILGTG
jgi:hypothetical protein